MRSTFAGRIQTSVAAGVIKQKCVCCIGCVRAGGRSIGKNYLCKRSFCFIMTAMSDCKQKNIQM